MAAATTLSWVGALVHNAMELPQLTLASPENAVPALVAVALFTAWWWGSRRAGGIALLAWGLLHLGVGAVLTVLPLGILPFSPEQSASHYAAHTVYGVAQVPLLVLAWRDARPAPS